jgi:hypothetical protein
VVFQRPECKIDTDVVAEPPHLLPCTCSIAAVAMQMMYDNPQLANSYLAAFQASIGILLTNSAHHSVQYNVAGCSMWMGFV